MVLVLLEVLVELTLKDHQLEPVFVTLDSPAIIMSVLVVLLEPYGAQLQASVSMFVDKTQPSQALLMLVFAMMDLDY